MNDIERELRDIEMSIELPASLAEVLDHAMSFVRRFVVLTDPQAIVVALWLAHVFAFELRRRRFICTSRRRCLVQARLGFWRSWRPSSVRSTA